jgi:hypothetical protein
MLHHAYKKGTVAKYYYLLCGIKYETNHKALVQFNQDCNIDWNIVQKAIEQIFEEQKKLF